MTHVLQLGGSDEEIGMQQGKELAAQINDGLRVVRNLEEMKMAKPIWMPRSLFMMLAGRRLSRPLWRDIKLFCPGQASRLENLALGAGVDLQDILFLQSVEMLIGNPAYTTGGCTSIGLDSSRTATEEVVVARNFDYRTPLAPFQIACLLKPKDGYRNFTFKMASLTGAIDGMNEHGLAITYNLAYTTDRMVHHIPLTMIIQQALETCRTTSEAVDFVKVAKVGGHAALVTIADAAGEIGVVEVTPERKAAREAKDGMVVNTNHYQIGEMKQHQIPEDAIFSNKSPNRGKRVLESSERRLNRAHQMLTDSGRVDETRMSAILKDHGEDGVPSRNTVCMHGPWASTIRSTIYYPRKLAIKTLYGSPCQGEYEELWLKDWV